MKTTRNGGTNLSSLTETKTMNMKAGTLKVMRMMKRKTKFGINQLSERTKLRRKLQESSKKHQSLRRRSRLKRIKTRTRRKAKARARNHKLYERVFQYHSILLGFWGFGVLGFWGFGYIRY